MLWENGGEKAEPKGKWKIFTPFPIKKKVLLYDKSFWDLSFYILSKWKRHVNTVLKFCPKIAVLWFSVVFLFQPLCSLSSEIKCLWESRVFTIAIGASIFFKPNPVLLSWKCSSQIELLKSLAWKMILRGLDLSRNLLKNDGEKRCKFRLMIGALFLKCGICMFSLRI